jgi:hypothetical protein
MVSLYHYNLTTANSFAFILFVLLSNVLLEHEHCQFLLGVQFEETQSRINLCNL